MRKIRLKSASLIPFTYPLIIYEITFVIFVIYFIQPATIIYRLSLGAIGLSVLTVFFKLLFSYAGKKTAYRWSRNTNFLNILLQLLFLAIYFFCFLVQTEQWRAPAAPSIIIIWMLAVPPLVALAAFLYSETSPSGD